jgi:hypothetical protein
MPNRNGTGPLGQGSRTGRGMGNCHSPGVITKHNSSPARTQPLGLGGHMLDALVGIFFGHRRGDRAIRK